MTNEDPKNKLEQNLLDVLFSDEFRRRTALVTLPTVAAGAFGVAVGCAGFNVYADSACDPLKHQRHDHHIEQDASTTSSTSAAVTLSGVGVLPPGDQELSQATLDLWSRRVHRKPIGHTMNAWVFTATDDTAPPASPSA